MLSVTLTVSTSLLSRRHLFSAIHINSLLSLFPSSSPSVFTFGYSIFHYPSSIPSMVPASLHLSVIPTVSPSIPHDVTFISSVIFTIGSHFIFSIFRANKLIQSSPFQCHPRQFFTIFISIQFSFCPYLLEFHKRYYLKIHLRHSILTFGYSVYVSIISTF